MLGEDFPEQGRFREIFGADDDDVFTRRAAPGAKYGDNAEKDGKAARRADWVHQERTGRRRRSRSPSIKSAAIARSAAGMAPARMSWSLTMARPRKMNSPRPPAPIAAAIVATPMVSTVEIRMPASMVENERGSSTRQRIWEPVMPMPLAASRTDLLLSTIPAGVLRMVGRSA